MREMIKRAVRNSGFEDTMKAFRFDFARMRARLRTNRMLKQQLKDGPLPTHLHFGCGGRRVDGWLNCDLSESDIDIDLALGQLPFQNDYFDVALSQHTIEHLRIHRDLKPLLKELLRVLKSRGEIWLTCPNIKKMCDSYASKKCADLVAAKQVRWPNYSLQGLPSSQFMNDIFHQGGSHKNLFDFELLQALLKSEGFVDIEEVDETALLKRFEGFPSRNDDEQTLYVKANKA